MSGTPRPDGSLETKRLILREARILDLPALFQLFQDSKVMQHWGPILDLPKTRDYVNKMVQSPVNGILAFIIVLPPTSPFALSAKDPPLHSFDEGIVIGHAGVWFKDQGELVFMLDSAHWRNGYMTEVMSVLVPILWHNGLKTVYADVHPANKASLTLLTNFGFVTVGENIAELHDKWSGHPSTLRMKLKNPAFVHSDEEGLDDGSGRSSEDG